MRCCKHGIPERIPFFLPAAIAWTDVLLRSQSESAAYSYKLAIVSFWVLVGVWAAPSIAYTALPEWISSLGMISSVLLWPSGQCQ